MNFLLNWSGEDDFLNGMPAAIDKTEFMIFGFDLNSTWRPLITQIMCPSRKTHLILKESI